jgi:pyruvate dehydrogenase E2 component (dihydrolipoamide acetyltransferase)
VSVAQITEVRMPRLSDSMEEGTIVRWLKDAGEAVAAGDALVEIETDKATMEYEAEANGTLEILAAEGATVALGEAIARLLPDGDAPSPPRGERPQRILATPVARRMASELGVDLSTVTATGRRGQIMKADVEAFAASNGHGNGTPPARAPEPAPAPAEAGREELTRAQRTIARRMAESRAVVPDIELVVDIDMGACLALRAQLAEHHSPPPRSTTWSSRRARWPCASTRA